ncbi:hypothetical protein KR054_008849 [Drosophila jambulina]|nr:hypothetical protein KR054_008849 [Drosophila jambulina]
MTDNEKPAMLYLEPRDSIVLEGPFNRWMRKSIIIENPRKFLSVAFKLETITPHLFFVRPKTGVLGPGEEVTVDVFLKPTAEDVGQHCPMILIQSAVVFGNDIDLQEFWKTQNSVIWRTKIKIELVPNKSSEKHVRQDVGNATDSPKEKDVTGKTNILIQDECPALKEHVDVSDNQDMAAKCNERIMQPPQSRSTSGYFKFFMFLMIIAASIAGAYYGMEYL